MNAVESLERDVAMCGVPLGDVRALGKRYERAIQSGSCADWIELYVGVFVTLLRNSHRTRRAEESAARRMLELLGDDLGVQLFNEEALQEVQGALLQPAA
ncbi:MAG TPA: hypothetical protein VKT72_08845 [Candidatus Baltobacteraceae bacterium]|nr:hypothetical protein [Candidatus Baltobacteraceae bacterium]